MEKPIIATTLSGLFVSSKPWKKAHELWFAERAKELKDLAIKEYAFKENYFQYVDIVMARLKPGLSEKERTTLARSLFFDSVLQYIKKHPEAVRKDVADYFRGMKRKYRLALLTTNEQHTLNLMLPLLGVEDLFDIVESSFAEEKDDKKLVFDRFLEKYGKPMVYIGRDKKETYEYCKKKGMAVIFTNFEEADEIPGVESVHTLEELKEELDRLHA